MEKIAIVIADSNGCFPVPAAKGGAVTILMDHFLENNEKEKKCELYVYSYYDENAYTQSKKYKNTQVIWIKVPKIIQKMDSIFFKIASSLKIKKSISYKSIFSLIYYIHNVSKKLKKSEYDRLIIENNILLSWVIKLSKYKKNYYYHFHNIPRINGKAKEVFSKCNGYLCVSKFVANKISSDDSAIGKIDEEKVKVLYNCIDTKRFYNLPKENYVMKYRKQFGLSKEDKIILFVGRLSEEKGIDKILKAVSEIDDDKIKVLIVGSIMHFDNSGKDKFKDGLIELSNKMPGKVIFTGYIDQEDLINVYNLADLAVLPSVWEEPAGLTMIEALACGLPVITTRTGGIPEYVGETAVLIDNDEEIVESIKKNILDILWQKNNIKTENGIIRINENFNSEKYLDNFLNALKSFDNGECNDK